MSRRKRESLVFEHLENISRSALEDYQVIIREYVRGKQGVYALYRRNKLYYVGLASNLRNRLKAHLKDHHGKSWDRFSVYLTHGDDHLKELESLVLRIVHPAGNKVMGKFAGSENLAHQFRRDILAYMRRSADEVLGARPRVLRAGRVKGRLPSRGKLPLAGVFARSVVLRVRYKGKLYRARLRRDGTIQYGHNSYRSPSHAATVICRRAVNGWSFWRYERKPGDWVRLCELRR